MQSPLFLDIDECRSDPCVNGGTCTDLVDGYKCTCMPGYAGQYCQRSKNDIMVLK